MSKRPLKPSVGADAAAGAPNATTAVDDEEKSVATKRIKKSDQQQPQQQKHQSSLIRESCDGFLTYCSFTCVILVGLSCIGFLVLYVVDFFRFHTYY
jgi:hypothetical protein